MRNLLLGAAAAASLICTVAVVGAAQAEPQGRLIIALDRGDSPATLQDAQFIFGGQNYCWYATGWQGPGFYWCGYAWRRGLGWGGGAGWHGWRAGGGGGQVGAVRSGYNGGVRAGGARVAASRTSRGGSRPGHGAVRTANRASGADHGGGRDRKPGK